MNLDKENVNKFTNKPFKEVVLLFLRLGLTAFGGPAAHIAIMHDEVVRRRRWISEQHFLDLLGATNLIPGPNSTEMAIHIGFVRAGWPGLVGGGLAFILPAMLMVMGLAWAYVRYGSAPQTGWILYGIKPVVIILILQALWSLGQKAIKNGFLLAAAVLVAAFYFLGINELVLLWGGGIVIMLVANRKLIRNLRRPGSSLPVLLFLNRLRPEAGLLLSAPFNLLQMFLLFTKIGALLYGGGYVLLAFLQGDFVERLGWITQQQLLDAIAIGQVTPGPLFTSAAFIGYLLAGVPGALVGTLGIFLPSFIFVAISNPLIPKLRGSPWTSALLDGVNATAIGLMAGVTVQLAGNAFVDGYTIGMGLISAVLLFRFKINSTWLVLGGALIGIIIHTLA